MLDYDVRGALDQVIDQLADGLPTTMSWLRGGVHKTNLHIENEKDYALGYAHGAIKASFLYTFMTLKKRQPNAEETAEADTIIYKRTAELRDSIFKSG